MSKLAGHCFLANDGPTERQMAELMTTYRCLQSLAIDACSVSWTQMRTWRSVVDVERQPSNERRAIINSSSP